MDTRPPIRRLPEGAVNRIAAGEVIERPAAAAKELVENALDAGATRIDVHYADGGRTLLRVADDGCGIPREALALALERHATSKTDGGDLLDIGTFGFRGEALPSMGAVARLGVTSRVAGEAAWRLDCEAGRLSEPRPAAHGAGTTVELRDLFFATPARLKFLKSERAEAQALVEAVRRLAMAHPQVAFALRDGERLVWQVPAQGPRERLAAAMGRAFEGAALELEAERDGIRLTGLASPPTEHRGNAQAQHLFVNGRPVRDPLLAGAARGAYADVLPKGRHAMLALFVEIDRQAVDVNVHPAKAEVRFREPAVVRGLIVGALRAALAEAGVRAAPLIGVGALGATAAATPAASPPTSSGGFAERPAPWRPPPPEAGLDVGGWGAPAAPSEPGPVPDEARPLGTPRAQVHDAYVIAQTAEGVVLVDQHAAHERLVYEAMKARLMEGGTVPRQALLLPEVVELPPGRAAALTEGAEALAALGLEIEGFGPGAVMVRATPAPLGATEAAALVREIAESPDLLSAPLEERLRMFCATAACHGSVRAGRRLSHAEMDALLRAMEAEPAALTCNHGRPTVVRLGLAEIERLFARR